MTNLALLLRHRENANEAQKNPRERLELAADAVCLNARAWVASVFAKTLVRIAENWTAVDVTVNIRRKTVGRDGTTTMSKN
jgi:hypothetical protein